MKFKNLIVILIILVNWEYVFSDYSGSPVYFINPGLKIGYEFGKQNGFILGCELSTGYSESFLLFGLVSGLQKNINQNKYLGYFECEAGHWFGGLALGMEIGSEEYKSPRLRCYGGAALYLSLRYSFIGNMFEVSIVGKEVILPVEGFNLLL
jgi:hypothetical protein